MSNIFQGRNLLIATKHEKEKVITPIFEKEIGVKCFVSPAIDTDEFGTFTGEVDRKDDPLTTVRNKCLMAMKITACDMAIASEGSFGPHPSILFMPADDEFIIFIDHKNKLEIIERVLSTDTNFNGKEIRTEKELVDFAKSIKFPSHGLILKKSKVENAELIKGIRDWNLLITSFHVLLNKYGQVYVMTDMRAMFNPTRMEVIEKVATKLVKKIQSQCPECSTPGFGITAVIRGLPCSLCGLKTRSTLSFQYTCTQCAYTKEDQFPHGKTEEDPMYCDFCNP
ncbi:hypothetical protein BH11BAC2_BH11BAC2_09110 [soil metagenome]